MVFLSASCSLATAIVTTKLSGIISRKNHKEDKLNEKRLEVYNEIITGIDKLITLPNSVFDGEYFADCVLKYKGYMKLIASKQTQNAYMKFCKYVKEEYSNAVRSEQYNSYIMENEPSPEDVYKIVNPLIDGMRKDIGNAKLY